MRRRFEDHEHAGLETDGSRQAGHQNLLYGISNYGNITQINWKSNSLITVQAGCGLMIDGKYLMNHQAIDIPRCRATISEKEYLYAWENEGRLAFVMSITVPVFDADRGYWIETGNSARRWMGISCPKDGSGDYYKFAVTGQGANRAYFDFTIHYTAGKTLLSGGAAASTYYLIDISPYVYKPTKSNIIGHRAHAYFNGLNGSQITLYENVIGGLDDHRRLYMCGYCVPFQITKDVLTDLSNYYVYFTFNETVEEDYLGTYFAF